MQRERGLDRFLLFLTGPTSQWWTRRHSPAEAAAEENAENGAPEQR